MTFYWYYHLIAILFYLIIALFSEKVNGLRKSQWIGFKTRLSKLNEHTQNEANSFSSKIMWVISIEMTIEHLLLYLVFKYNYLPTYLSLFALKSILVIPITEYHLKSLFDENGNFKKHLN
ncbi:hypothetical protein [Marivirga atlantica]|jgi:hypothetical protein|uniref:Uncharacterized protein n=1 Tax=Marivirga atlantica TaxID=1548457 RepID=A0A937DFM4_9BACT|nr:hypothetical protein [Marivirga atlantica]MBL0763833.1 hypothetical protein [Marivirga atlantica]